ncbi:MAG: hypothetical protein ACRDPQ_13480 [Nocardioidaceae bacterium]
MRKFRLAATTGAAAIALATTVSMPPAANADTAVFADARGDAPGHIDLTRATIDNGDALPAKVLMRIRVRGTLDLGDHIAVFFNRNVANPGPELKLSSFVDSEFTLRRVNTWTGNGVPASCADFALKQFADNHGVRVRINRSCLDGPARVAIRTRSDDGQVDWFQARRTFLPAVHA